MDYSYEIVCGNQLLQSGDGQNTQSEPPGLISLRGLAYTEASSKIVRRCCGGAAALRKRIVMSLQCSLKPVQRVLWPSLCTCVANDAEPRGYQCGRSVAVPFIVNAAGSTRCHAFQSSVWPATNAVPFNLQCGRQQMPCLSIFSVAGNRCRAFQSSVWPATDAAPFNLQCGQQQMPSQLFQSVVAAVYLHL